MPLWEGILASFCAGLGVSLVNRFGLSQIKTPCEREAASRYRDDPSSDDGGETVAAAFSAGAHCHNGAE